MAVGKSSIQRVKAVSENITEENVKMIPTEENVNEQAAVKKTSVKKTAVKKTADSKKDDIHEKKFEMIDGIYSDLPTYLL